MTTHPSSATIQPRWLIIVGGATFLITTLTPLLIGEVFSGLWTINSLISCCVRPETAGEVTFLSGAFLALPILLSLFAISLWKRMLKANRPLTARRGLLTFLLADLLAALSGFLLVTICVFLPAFLILNSESLGFLGLALYTVVVSQTFYSLPFLLIAGALIAQWQAHS